ncbi:MAG: type II toxin-antitoxin system VapC family toxin [Candidatus Nanohaloarchaea archaeon]
MQELFADTNIFGIAVDPEDDRRSDVWEELEKVSNGEKKLITSGLTISEIEDNPHEETREKEMDLLEILTDEKVELSEDVIELSEKLEKEAGIGVVDSQILASAILREAVFWTGDRNLMNEQNIEKLHDALDKFDSDLELNYRIE